MKYPYGPEYPDNLPTKTIKAEAFMSLGHVTGNIIGAFREAFIKKFPKNLFKTIHTDTRAAFVEISSIDKENDDHLLSNSKPSVVISPRYDYNYVSEFFSSYFHDNMSPYDERTEDSFTGTPYADHKLGTVLKNTFTRCQIKFEINMQFETEMENRNAFSYATRKLPYDRFFPYLPITLECQIPREFIKQIASDSGFIMAGQKYIPPEKMSDFMKYLNNHCPESGMRFIQKIKNSTANAEIFIAFTVDAMYYMDGPITVDEGDKQGMTRSGFGMNMTFNLQCTIPSIFYYYSGHSHYDFVTEEPSLPDNTITHTIAVFKYDYIPYTVNIGGRMLALYTQSGYMIDDDLATEVICIDGLFDDRLNRIKELYHKNGLLPDFYSISVYENQEFKKGGSLDPYKYELTLHDMKKNNDYMIVLYVDQNAIANIENLYSSKDVIIDGKLNILEAEAKRKAGNQSIEEEYQED